MVALCLLYVAPNLLRCQTDNLTAEEEISQRKAKLNSPPPAPVTGVATTASPAAVIPSIPSVPSSSQSPLLQEPPPGHTPQQTHNSSSGDSLASQPQQASPESLVTTPGPDTHSPGTGTTELTPGNSSDEAANDPVPPPDNPDHSGRSLAGAFPYNGSSQFITEAALQYLKTIPAGQHWTAMVTSFLRLEEFPIPLDVRIFLFLLAHSY